ncbi:MAG: hypothetical protein ACLR6B_07540 [Blautia sp.]
MIRVLVVDDMQPICRRYEKLINQEEDMEVVGLAFPGRKRWKWCELWSRT